MARHSIEIPFKKSKDSFFDDDSSLFRFFRWGILRIEFEVTCR